MRLLFLLSVAGALACALWGWACLQAYRQARRRMHRLLRPDSRPPGGLRRLEAWFAATSPGRAAAAYLEKAGLRLSPVQYAVVLIVAGLVLYAFAASSLALGPLGAASVVFIVLPLLAGGYLHLRRQRFLHELQQQLPELALMLGNALKAGHSIRQGLVFLAEHARPPARAVFARCREELALGRPLDETLQDVIRRYQSPDLHLLLVSVLVQQQAGGNLIAALDTIARTLRHRQETMGEVRATQAQARQTVQVLPFLPFLSALMFNVAMPGFLAPLFTPPGLLLLGAVVALQAGVYLLIRRVARIEV